MAKFNAYFAVSRLRTQSPEPFAPLGERSPYGREKGVYRLTGIEAQRILRRIGRLKSGKLAREQ
jgi:hypothetical protein